MDNLPKKVVSGFANISPISKYESSSNTIYINKEKNLKEVGEKLYNKGWNSQNNPILHELAHFIYAKYNPKYYQDKDQYIDFEGLKEVSDYAFESKKQGEFEAELIAGILSGKRYSQSLLRYSFLNGNSNPVIKEIYERGFGPLKEN